MRSHPFLWIKQYMPQALFLRSMLIVIIPVVLAQIAVAFLFMERHWNSVTQKLSNAVVNDISSLVDLRMREQGIDEELLSQLASDSFDMSIAFLPGENLPPPTKAPVVALLQSAISHEIEQKIGRPYWVDTVTYEKYVDIRILLPGEVMRILTQRERVYATNTHIFLLWMGVASMFLILISITFLRNQIRPIERLAVAAESFGRGQDIPDFKPSGALEVRKAAENFIEMHDRIKRHLEQRTTMLSGVSHDLRTPLTRLKLQLELLPQGEETQELKSDVSEMENMLDDYLDFARGYAGEKTEHIALNELLERVLYDAKRRWPNHNLSLQQSVSKSAPIKQQAYTRLLMNLINNACIYAQSVVLAAFFDGQENLVTIMIDDDGPGIPPEKYEDVFRPFYRLDDARTGIGGTGLGLSIARDIARSHGGDIRLCQSKLGGLRCQITLPA